MAVNEKRYYFARGLVLLLAFCMFLTLASCGKEEEPEWRTIGKSLAMAENMAYISAQCVVDGLVYIGGLGAQHAVHARVALDGTSEIIDLPKDYEYIYAMCEADGNIALLIGDYPAVYYDANGERVETCEEGELYILVLDKNGDMVNETALVEPGAEYDFMLYSDGYFIVLNMQCAVKLGNDGRELTRIEAGDGEHFSSMILYKGEVLISVTEPNL